MWSFVETPIDAMNAALNGSTVLPAIEVFHALLAGNGRLIAPSTLGFVAAAAVVVAFVAAADDEVAALGLGVALVGDDVAESVDEDSAPKLPCASAVCVPALLQPPTTSTSAVTAASTTWSRGRLTVAG
jgi:hypothetical protein